MKNTEIWKDIPNYEGLYQVSNLGRVKSLARAVIRGDGQNQTVKEKVLKVGVNTSGYLSIALAKNGVKKTHKVHKLVAITFLGHKPNGMKIVVNHINNVKTDNRADNLELVSNRYNVSVDQWRYNRTSKFTGVSLTGKYKDSSLRWKATITINNKKKHLGYFRNEEEAAAAYQEALKQIQNESHAN